MTEVNELDQLLAYQAGQMTYATLADYLDAFADKTGNDAGPLMREAARRLRPMKVISRSIPAGAFVKTSEADRLLRIVTDANHRLDTRPAE